MNDNKLLILLNQGSREDLMKLTGIGEVLADSLVAARPFDSLTDAQEVNGISANLIEHMQQQVAQSDLWSDFDAEIESEKKEKGEEAESGELQTGKDQVVQEALADKDEAVGEGENSAPAEFMEAEQAVGEVASEPFLAASQPVTETSTDNRIEAEPEPERSAEISREEPAEVKDKHAELEQVSQSVSVEEGAADQPKPEKPEPVSKAGVSVFALFATNFLTAMVAILLTLIVLAGINGSLRFATQAEFQSLQRESSQLSTQAETLQQELAGLRSRVDTLEGLGERLVVMESTQEQFSTDLETTNQLVSDVQSDLTVLNEQVEQQSERTQRFETFLLDLQALLSGLFAPEGE
jgi:cell division protein FtsL